MENLPWRGGRAELIRSVLSYLSIQISHPPPPPNSYSASKRTTVAIWSMFCFWGGCEGTSFMYLFPTPSWLTESIAGDMVLLIDSPGRGRGVVHHAKRPNHTSLSASPLTPYPFLPPPPPNQPPRAPPSSRTYQSQSPNHSFSPPFNPELSSRTPLPPPPLFLNQEALTVLLSWKRGQQGIHRGADVPVRERGGDDEGR